MAKIEIKSQGSARVYEVLDELVTIGRDEKNHIRLKDASASLFEARLVRGTSGWRIEAAEEGRKFTVNGLTVRAADLEPGDKVGLGNVELMFVSGDGDAAPAQAPAVGQPAAPHAPASRSSASRTGPQRARAHAPASAGHARADDRSSGARHARQLRDPSPMSGQKVGIIVSILSLSILAVYLVYKLLTSEGLANDPKETFKDAVKLVAEGSNDAAERKLALIETRSPDAALSITAVDSVVPASSTTSTAIAFSDSAFLFTLDPVQVAGRDQAISVALWAKNSATAATCTVVTTYTGLKNLKAWIARDVSDPGGTAPKIGLLNLPNAQPGANNLTTLNFAAGVASFNLSTTDVGKYTLNLRDDTSPFTTPALGASNLITTRPFGIAITNVRQGVTLNPGGTASAGGAFVSAGDVFQATVSSYLWAAVDDLNNDGVPDAGADITNNGTTPAYKWPTTLSVAAPYTPAAGTLGALGGTVAIAPASFSAGAATVANLTYSEAGSVTLQAAAVNFLGSAGVNYTATSGVVGRFFADHFALLAGVSVTPACGSFTYMDQALSALSFNIEAQAKTSSTRLNNYNTATNSFAIATVKVLAEDTGAGNDGVDQSARVSGVPAPGWVAGQYLVSTAAAKFARAASPDGPYTALQLGVQVNADPNGALLVARDMNPATAGVCAGAGCTGVKLNAVATAVRYGRLRLINGVNSQLLPVTLIAETQYYLNSAGGFTVNSFDSCTPLSAANFTLGNGQGIATSTVQVNVASGTLVSGRKSLTISQAGNSAVGPGGTTKSSVDVGLNLGATASGQFCSGTFAANTGAALVHLRARWCTSTALWDRDPVARAVFGLYAGSDRLLLLRENY